MEFINFLNTYNGALSLILTFVLILVTFYFSMHSKKLTKKAQELINQDKSKKENESLKITNNHAYLINSEIVMNIYYFATLMFFYKEYKDQNEKINMKIVNFLSKFGFNTTNPNNELGAFINNFIKDSIWNSSSNEMAKYFSNEAMLELTGYYTGVAYFKSQYTMHSIPNDSLVDMIKGQLISSKKCLTLLEGTTNQELRGPDELITINNAHVKIDYTSGEIFVC